MPKDTFFNLELKKRTKILTAARKEFTRAPLDKVKVSNIVTLAEIPRGSFYQYFEDIDDLFYYFVEDIQSEREKVMLQFAVEEQGDIFNYALKLFGYEYDQFLTNNRHNLMMNVFKSMALNNEYFAKYNKRRQEHILNILSEIKVDNIKYSSESDLLKIFQLIQDQRRNLIHKSMFKKATKEEVIEGYKWYIDILKFGLLKEDTHE